MSHLVRFPQDQRGFTGAEKALLVCFALAIVLLVGFLLRGGSEQAAGDARRVLAQGQGGVNPSPAGLGLGLGPGRAPRAGPPPPAPPAAAPGPQAVQPHGGGSPWGAVGGWFQDRGNDIGHVAQGAGTLAVGGLQWTGDRIDDFSTATNLKQFDPLVDHRTHADYLREQQQAVATIRDNVHPDDLMVAFAGTGNSLHGQVNRSGDIAPDGNTALNGAIATAQAAGVDPAQGHFAVWGYDIPPSVRWFWYRVPGAQPPEYVKVWNLGGKNAVADGPGPGYLSPNLNRDSRDFITRFDRARRDPRDYPGLQTGGKLVLVGHSWGGAVVEHTVSDLNRSHPSVPVALAVTAGVPAKVAGPGYENFGPGSSVHGGVPVVEVDRPDDPIHGMLTRPPFGPWLDGHDYNIRDGSGRYLGFYGITDPKKLRGGKNLPGIAR